jgi:sugar-specific transcriptional regulator TrmB
MELKLLEEIGLSKRESNVYVSLLELGVSTVGPLIKRSGIPSSHIYPLLENLTNKGLVSYTITANKRYFKAEDPKRLRDIVDEQKKQIEEQEIKIDSLISELSGRQNKLEKTQESFTYEGIKGIKTALEFVLKVLKKGDTFRVVDASKISNENLRVYFDDFSKRRAKSGIKYEIIYGTDLREFAEERARDKLTEVRILPKNLEIPSVFWIFNEYVVIAVFSEQPIALLIKNRQISKGFLANFEILRGISKKL